MNAYTTAEGESSVTADSTDLEQRDVRALTECMTVLPDTGRVKDADDLYLVISESGSEYLIDAREGVCECPDYRHREPESGCKHILRTQYATGERAIPEWADSDAVDPQLGMHTNAAPLDSLATLSLSDKTSNASSETLQTDGGVSAGQPASNDPIDDGPRYTYHYEPAHVGGERYVRCETCGAECIPAKPERLLHREGCSEGDR